jgi:predicted unusual protein kinase regulating ubiquinone biosynthesis (AarF/ABC1/UbiB family)
MLRLLLLCVLVGVSAALRAVRCRVYDVRGFSMNAVSAAAPATLLAPKAKAKAAPVAAVPRLRKRDFLLRTINKAADKISEAMMDAGWKGRADRGSFRRGLELWVFAVQFFIRWSKANRLKKNPDPEVFKSAQVELATILRDKLLVLGPAFIKLGQLLSTRIDVLPRPYINALELLQDQVPGFSGEEAKKILEKELGKPVSQLFDTFNSTPIAAASLGQVHVATKGGKKFAVKVQRPGLKELFDVDLKNIRTLAKLLDNVDPKTDGAARDWNSIFEESARLLYKEIDYKAEALNCVRFRENFANVPWVKVPEVDLSLTTERVVVMEYVPGIKINDLKRIDEAKINRELLAKRSAEAYLTQLCRHGFFHCDPHPGNVACDAEFGGRLIFYDFGMMDELKVDVRTGLVNLIFSVFENDAKEACNALEEIGVLRKDVDRVSIERIARVFLGDFKRGVSKGEKWVNQLSKEEQKEIRRKRRQQLGSDLFSLQGDAPFKFPPTFTFVFRAFTSLDGIGKGLDPTYDLTRLSQPYLKELVDLRDGSAFVSGLKKLAKSLGWRPIDIANAVQSPRKVAEMDDILRRMEQGELKVRVRNLDAERSFKRLELLGAVQGNAVVGSIFLNLALLLGSRSVQVPSLRLATKLAFAVATFCGLQLPFGLLKLKKLERGAFSD